MWCECSVSARFTHALRGVWGALRRIGQNTSYVDVGG